MLAVEYQYGKVTGPHRKNGIRKTPVLDVDDLLASGYHDFLSH